MALKGKLRDFSLTQLLNLVHLARKSGGLALGSPAGKAELYFSEGKLIYARREGESGELAELMVRAGKITAAHAEAARRSGRVKDDRQLGLLLINAGRVTRQEILEALRKHMLEVVHATLEWDEGSFIFDQKRTPPGGRIKLPIGLESIVLEGSRRRETRSELQSELPSLDVVLKFTEGRGSNLRNVQLSVDEWRVISFVNPTNTVKTIAQYNQMSDFEVRKIVTKLIRDDLVEVAGAGANGGTASAAAATPSPVSGPLIQQPQPQSRPRPSFSEPQVERTIIRRLIDRIRRL